jgi:hypothetical protein
MLTGPAGTWFRLISARTVLKRSTRTAMTPPPRNSSRTTPSTANPAGQPPEWEAEQRPEIDAPVGRPRPRGSPGEAPRQPREPAERQKRTGTPSTRPGPLTADWLFRSLSSPASPPPRLFVSSLNSSSSLPRRLPRHFAACFFLAAFFAFDFLFLKSLSYCLLSGPLVSSFCFGSVLVPHHPIRDVGSGWCGTPRSKKDRPTSTAGAGTQGTRQPPANHRADHPLIWTVEPSRYGTSLP